MKKSDISELYFITHQGNLLSIFNRGILSHNQVETIPHTRIDNPAVQIHRNYELPDGTCPHDYANLFFNPRNAMMCSRVHSPFDHCDLCIIGVNKSVLDIPGALASDMNVAKEKSLVLPIHAALPRLNWSEINYTKYWGGSDAKAKRIQARMMAEVLVPPPITLKYFKRLLVSCLQGFWNLQQRIEKCPIDVWISHYHFLQARQPPYKVASGGGES